MGGVVRDEVHQSSELRNEPYQTSIFLQPIQGCRQLAALSPAGVRRRAGNTPSGGAGWRSRKPAMSASSSGEIEAVNLRQFGGMQEKDES